MKHLRVRWKDIVILTIFIIKTRVSTIVKFGVHLKSNMLDNMITKKGT